MDPQETKIYITLLTAGLLFCIVVIFFGITIVRYQRRGVAAYLDRMQADLNLLEKERAQLALDLHDELGSQLAAVQLLINEVTDNRTDVGTLTLRLTSLIEGIRVSIRQLSNSLVSYSLQREGLKTGIDELVEKMFRDASLQISVEWKLESFPLTRQAEIHVYRIIQELLTNIITHAQASHIDLSLSQSGNKVLLYIADNGKGFNEAQVTKTSNGLGLRNVSARVNVLKGVIHLTTRPSAGTAYEIELPADN